MLPELSLLVTIKFSERRRRKKRYKAYFKDMFGGDCTDKGKRLLAVNIASAILEALLGK
ncbi:MAG: hypothetical protein ABH806_03020 [Candidatus Omnitrophota bacterium]